MMKTLLISSLWFGFVIKAFAGQPTTFAEFKQLPPAQRDALVADVMQDSYNPARLQLINWWLRLRMGEESWRWDQQRLLVFQNEYYGLENFFGNYHNLRQSSSTHEWAALNAKGIPPAELSQVRKQFAERDTADSMIYHNIIPLLASLAPSAEAKALNERAQQLASELDKRYLNQAITRQEVVELDKREQELLDQVKKLPKLTAEQEQAAIDALPPSHGLPRGIKYPSKYIGSHSSAEWRHRGRWRRFRVDRPGSH